MTGMSFEERARQLMMKELDGEISPAEHDELQRALAESTSLAKEWESMSRVKSVTSNVLRSDPPAEVFDEYWESVYARTERKVGWVLVSIGALVLGAVALFEFVTSIWTETGTPLWQKLAIYSLAFGGLILFVSVVRERLFSYKRDPYRKVKR